MVTRCCACALVLDRKIKKLGRSSSTVKINPPSLRRSLVNIGASLFLKVRHKKRTTQFKLNVSQISVVLWFQEKNAARISRGIRVLRSRSADYLGTSCNCTVHLSI